jgi:uncharacterized protein involved in cysteine biosynthesis
LEGWSFEWREEMAVAESHPVLVAGFGLTTAALLAAPVVNLFFRPIIIVAAVHLLGQLAREEKAIVATSLVPMASAQAPGPTVPTEPATAAMRSS